ncbi:hypothetical protein ACFL1B_02275 [Nanoarchaeota archaeon]
MRPRNRAQCNGVHGRRTFLIAIALLMLIPLAQAITLQVFAPESIREGELLSVSFTATGNTSQHIFKDTIQVGTDSYAWQTDTNDAGTYTFKFLANNTNESAEETRVVEVLEVLPELSIVSPQSGVITTEQIRISVQTEMEAITCTYTLNSGTPGELNQGNNEWYKVILLSTDATYDLDVECTDGSDTATAETLFILDTTPPAITLKSPVGSFTGTPIPIEIETNENSLCKYSFEDIGFNSMTETFSQTGGTEHKQILNIKDQADITVYVACEDRHSNEMSGNDALTFFANLKPTAEIILEGGNKKEGLLKPGTYQIKVKASETVMEPSLEYQLSNDQRKRTIALEGEDDLWEGFMAIPEDIENDIGTFFFKAKDMTDLEGSEITQGKIFLVDTLAPDPLENLEATVDGIDIKLEWFYDGEVVDNFIIYRDTKPEVDYLDKWDETLEDFYLDQNVLLGQRYYYRVSPVDKAGNIGELSEEKNVIVEFEQVEEFTDPNVMAKFNQTQRMLEKNLMDIDLALKQLEAEEDNLKLEVINRLELIDNARQAKASIETLIREIEKLKLLGLNEGEANKRIEVFLSNAEQMLGQVAGSITIIDSTRHDQTLLERDLDEAINEALIGFDLDPDTKENYNAAMRHLQDKVSVTLEATSARIYWLETMIPDEVTLIHKKIISEEPVEEAMIIESIPKAVARKVTEVTFKDTPKILKPDPIVQWEYKEFTSRDIYYHVMKDVDMNEVKETWTALLTKPKIQDLAEITGAVIDEPEKESEIFSIVFLVIGMILVSSLLVYYVTFVRQETPTHQIMPSLIETRAHTAMRHAHRHINSINYAEALALYKDLISIDKTKVKRDMNRKIEIETRKLYEKLSLVKDIERGHHAIDTNDIVALKETMSSIKQKYNGFKKHSELAEHTRKSYSYFMGNLKKMDRDDFFNNLEL